MRILVTGADGQIGRVLVAHADAAGHRVTGLGRHGLDILYTDSVDEALTLVAPQLVVNCAGYTAVDAAEDDEYLAFAVNRDGAANVAGACDDAGVPLIHLSTDYVFDGSKDRPWREDDPTAPLGVYGASKAAGEVAVRTIARRAIVLRVSWVFTAEGQNFVTTMRRLGAERGEISVVADQHGGPTAADDIADAILAMAPRLIDKTFRDWGTYHFCGAPPTSWHGFATAVFDGRQGPSVRAITTSDYPTKARRPANSVLDCTRIREVFGIEQPDWRASLATVLARLDEAGGGSRS